MEELPCKGVMCPGQGNPAHNPFFVNFAFSLPYPRVSGFPETFNDTTIISFTPFGMFVMQQEVSYLVISGQGISYYSQVSKP